MQEKLRKLYIQIINELKTIGIDVTNTKKIGKIDIALSKRNNKRYGCCKQEQPDQNYKTITQKGRKKIIKYEKFNVHHIEISPWVLQLDEKIIKNTIIHELIHCMPYCNNHGAVFKKYADYINEKLGYNISRVGNPKEDYEKSNIEYHDTQIFKYKIICPKCGQEFYRKRLDKKFLTVYRCGICDGNFLVYELKSPNC